MMEQNKIRGTVLCLGDENPTVFYIPSKSPTYESSAVKFLRREQASGSSKGPEPVPSASGQSETAACPLSPAADDPSSPPFPTSASLPVSNSSCLFTRCQPMCASCYTSVVYFSRYCKIKHFYFCVCFLFIICMPSIINLLQYSTI